MNTEKPWWVPDTRAILAISLVYSVVGITFLVILKPPAADNQLAQVLVGALVTTGLAAIIGFYFGSSSSSKDKDDTISSMVTKQPSIEAAKETAKEAAKVEAPPAAAVAAPPAAEKAVAEALSERGIKDTPKENLTEPNLSPGTWSKT